MEWEKEGCAYIKYDAEGLKLRFSSPFSWQTTDLILGVQKISCKFARCENKSWSFVGSSCSSWEFSPLFHSQEHQKQPPIYASVSSPCIHQNRLFPLSPVIPAVWSAPSPSPFPGIHIRCAVSGGNFKQPCAQNKCRRSAMLKNKKSLNACYRNFFCVLVVKFRAVLNIYWTSADIPERSFSTSLTLSFLTWKMESTLPSCKMIMRTKSNYTP